MNEFLEFCQFLQPDVDLAAIGRSFSATRKEGLLLAEFVEWIAAHKPELGSTLHADFITL